MVDSLISALKQRITPTSHPRSIATLVTEILRGEHSELAAFEIGGKFAPRVLAGLQRLRDDAIADNLDAWFAFNSSSPDHIQGPCFVEPRDTAETRTAKLNRLNRYPLRPIIEELSPAQFESLCVGLLGLLGARDFSGTKRTRDQGIDFYGRLVISDLDPNTSPFFHITDHLSVWLVGQAKHYPNGKVSSAEIRELVGSINLARFKEYASTTDLMKSLLLRSCDPVFALFLTTGTFSRDAIKLAKGSGVITKGLDDICSVLADNEIGKDHAGNISRNIVHDWIDRQRPQFERG
jgi:hypothetical protein